MSVPYAVADFIFDASDGMAWRLYVREHTDLGRDFDGVECRRL